MIKAKNIFRADEWRDQVKAGEAFLRGEAVMITHIQKDDYHWFIEELNRLVHTYGRSIDLITGHDAACPLGEDGTLSIERCLCEHLSIGMQERVLRRPRNE